MDQYVDPKTLGLPARTIIQQFDKHTLAIVIDRKSRIIMADGIKILEKAALIKAVKPDMKVILKSTAPVCSKTLKLFEDNGLEYKLG